jgi:hypothetical protein
MIRQSIKIASLLGSQNVLPLMADYSETNKLMRTENCMSIRQSIEDFKKNRVKLGLKYVRDTAASAAGKALRVQRGIN